MKSGVELLLEERAQWRQQQYHAREMALCAKCASLRAELEQERAADIQVQQIVELLELDLATSQNRERVLRDLIRRVVEDRFAVNWDVWRTVGADARNAVSEMTGLPVEFIDAAALATPEGTAR